MSTPPHPTAPPEPRSAWEIQRRPSTGGYVRWGAFFSVWGAFFSVFALGCLSSYRALAAQGRPALFELGLACASAALAVLGVYPFAAWAAESRWHARLRSVAGRCLFCGATKTAGRRECSSCEAALPDAHELLWFTDTPPWPSVLTIGALAAAVCLLARDFVREPGAAVAMLVAVLLFVGGVVWVSSFSRLRGPRDLWRITQGHANGRSPGVHGECFVSATDRADGRLEFSVTERVSGATELASNALHDEGLGALARVLGAAVDAGELRVVEQRSLWWNSPLAGATGGPARDSYRAAPASAVGARSEARVVGVFRHELFKTLNGALTEDRAERPGSAVGASFVDLRSLADDVRSGHAVREALLTAAAALPSEAAQTSLGTRLVIARLRALGYE